MDSGGNMRNNEERGAEKQMDEYLKSIGLQRKKIAKDGSCLFRAVAEQVLHCQSLHTQVRAKCVEFLKTNRESYEAFIEGDFEDYLYKLRDPQQWVGEVEINALAMMYKRDFWIFQEPGRAAVNITANNFKDKVQLCFLNGNHYDSVYPISRVRNTAMCQSILYELLYDKVFKVERSLLGTCQRAPKSTDHIIDDNMAPCPSSDESDVETETHRLENGTSAAAVKQKGRGRGRMLLPDRVRRSLNPTLLRNVQYDVWHKSKKAQQKMDFCIAAGMQYNVGDRCQVRLENCGRSVSATIKKLSPDNGPVTVYTEEHKDLQVPLWKLRPPNEENSWSTVVRDRRVSNGHADWEDRGRGRGRGKAAPVPSGVSQTTAPPAGRVLKQHSWPPQATGDEREASNASRKPLCSEPVSFGLTKEQRMAKEEEERNAALVALHFRDEQSFPALGAQAGAQAEGGKKRSSDKRRSQKNTTRRSPVEEVQAPSPPTGDRPKSSTPPPPPPSSTTPTPAAPLSKPPASVTPPLSAAPAPKPSSLSYASAAAPLPPPPSTSTSSAPPPPTSTSSSTTATKPSQTGMVPSSASVFSFLTPVLPAASTSSSSNSSSSNSSSSSSFVAPKPTSLSPPTFIAPIAPSPAAAQSLIARPTPSPPLSNSAITHNPPAVVAEAPVQTANSTSDLSPPGGVVAPAHIDVSEPQQQSQLVSGSSLLPQNQVQDQASAPQTQAPPPQVQPQIQPPVSRDQTVPQSEPVPSHSPHPPPPSQVPYPSASLQNPTAHLSHPQAVPAVPAAHPNPDPPVVPAPQPQTEHPVPVTQPNPDPPPPVASPAPAPPQPDSVQPPPAPHHFLPPAHHPVPLQQHLSHFYQDPLYPGFPEGDKGQVNPTPPMSTNQSGDDLPQDMNILRFFFNLGVKAYLMPMHAPIMYLLPLQQAYTLQPRALSRSPSPSPLYHPQHHQPQPPPPPRPQEPPYPPFNPAHSAPQAPPPAPEPAHTPEPAYPNPGYPPAHHVHWQQPQVQPPQTNPAYPYPYAQGYYHQGPHSGQGPMEQQQPQPANGDAALGLRSARPGALEGSASANVANMANPNMVNVNGGQMSMLPGVNSFGHSNQDLRENMMLLVDPPLDKPIVINVPKSGSGPGSPALYSPASHSSDSSIAPFYMTHHKHTNHSAGFVPANHGAAYIPAGHGAAYIPAGHGAAFLPECLSVGCGTDKDWEEQQEEARAQFRGQRRGYRGRGRNPYRSRGYNNQYNNSQRGRGRY